MFRFRSRQWSVSRLSGSLLVVAGCLLAWHVFADAPSTKAIQPALAGPVIPKGKGENCVAETDFMRRDHMRLLIHQRDETVLRGIREEPFSLSECVDCHAQTADNGDPIRIDAEGQFCQSCHAYAAVKIDCFGCHAALPDLAVGGQVPGESSLHRLNTPESNLLSDLAIYHYGKKHASGTNY